MRSLAALALLLALASGDDSTTITSTTSGTTTVASTTDASSTVASTTTSVTTTTTTVAPTTTAVRVDPVCFNDGVAVNGSCQCSDYFQKPNCLRRPCFNGGYNADQQFHAQQCVCPQGFVGSFCEPQKCMAGETRTFSGAMSLRQLGVVFMWSKDVQQKVKNSGDDIVRAIANIKNDHNLKQLSSVIGFLPDGTTNVFEDADADSLQDDINGFLEAFCDGGCEGNLTTSLLMSALRALSPESVLVVVGNDGIADFGNTTALAALTQQAIAMRQKIVAGLFSPSKLADMSGMIYNDAAHTALRNLTEATQGFVVTPYNPSKLARYGSSSISQTIEALLPYAYSSIVAISQSVAASYDSFQFKGTNNSDAYMIVRNDLDYAFTTSFLSPIPAPQLVIHTGFVKVYKVVNNGDTIAVLMSASSASRLSVWTASGLRSHIAFSSDVPTLDASSPTAIQPDFPNTLVGRVEFNETLLNTSTLSATASGLSGSMIDRPACQFTLNLGSVTCTPGSLTTLTIATTQGFTQELPFFCISKETYMDQQKQAVTAPFYEETLEAEYEEWTEPADDDAYQCTDHATPSNLVPTDKRGLAVALLNTDRLTTTLLVEPDHNIMNSIYALSTSTNISFYAANIFTEQVVSNTKYSTNFGDFVTHVMNDAADEAELHELASTDCTDINHAKVIKDVLTSPDTCNIYNYDLILITDKQFPMNDTDAEMQQLITLLYEKRVRLFLVSVARSDCADYDFGSPAFDKYRQLAAQTSGLAVRAANVTEAYQFVDMYTKHLFDTTTVLTNDKIGVLNDVVNSVVSAPFPTTQGGKLIVESYPTVDRVELLDASNAVIGTLQQSSGIVAGSSVLFDLGQFKATSVRIVAPSLFSSVSWRLVAHESAAPALAFTSQSAVDVSSAYLSFTTVSAQMPVFSAAGGTHKLSVTDYKGAPILTQPFVPRANCTSFGQLLPFSLVCHEKRQIYYLRVDSLSDANVSSVHTYPFSCVDSAAGEGCLNGGKLVNGACVCPVGWSGAVCQSPICMNGGTAQPDGTCLCAAAFHGQFCQNALTACSASVVPALRSLTRSIMFVVERAKGVEAILGDLSKLPIANLPNVEYIVVQYYGVRNPDGSLSNNVIPRLQSTRKEELADALSFDPADGEVASTPICGAKAMFAALNMQTTESSELYWITETELIHTNIPWINDMGEKRSVLRGLTVADGPNLPSTTAMVSLSAGQLLRKITFKKFFTYVSALVDKQGTRKFERRANVIARDDSSCHPVQFTLTATSNVVVTNNATTGNLTDHSGAVVSANNTLGGGVNQTYTNVFIGLQPNMYTYTFAESSSCKYMLEALTDLQIGYSFSDSFLKEDQYSVARSGGNYMSIYTRNALFTDNLTVKDILSAKVTSVASDGSWNSTVLTSATQLTSCGYQFALQTDCSPGQLGTIVQLTGKLSIPGQTTTPTYNAVLTTPCVSKTSCQNGELDKDNAGRCTCYKGWSGVNCNLPVCVNGGRLAGEVCDCPPPYNGDQCQNNGALARAFIMLVDNCGSDAEITKQIQDANTQFAALFDFTKNKFALFGADGASMHDFQDVTSQQEYESLLLEVFDHKCKAAQDLKSAFVNISKSLQSLEASYVNLIYFSQSNSTLSDASLLLPLQQHKTNVVTVAMTGIYGDARPGVEAALRALGGSYALATDVYSALSIAVVAVHGADKPLPDPPARQPSCMHRLQASIFFSIQGTTTPGSVSMQAMEAVKSVISSFVSDLNTQSSVKMNQCTIGDDLTGKALVTGSYYEDDEGAQDAATFCVSGVPALINSKRNGYGKTITDFDSVLNFIGQFISKPCSCQRFDDKNTAKIMIWMPAQADVNPDAKADFSSYNLTLFQHIVAPVGFNITDSTVWNKVPGGHSVQKLSPDGKNVKEVVQDLWTTICKMADIIGPDVTAEPPAAASDQFWEYEGYEELPEYEEL